MSYSKTNPKCKKSGTDGAFSGFSDSLNLQVGETLFKNNSYFVNFLLYLE